MPTAYTAGIIESDITFEQYVWRCARAFGALIEMRDESLDAPIRLSAMKPDDYYSNSLKDAKKKLERYLKVTDAQALAQLEKDHADTVESYREMEVNRLAEQEKYSAMLQKVTAWVPPSKEHYGLKTFMIEQIQDSMRYGTEPYTPPKKPTVAEWRKHQLESLTHNVAYHEKALRENEERYRQRLEWLNQLVASVPLPKKK